MKLVTQEQIREIDREAIEESGIPGVTLMSNAAEHVAKAAMAKVPASGYVAVFCGTGNNGGDGIGAAAYLLEKGISIRVFIIGDVNKLTPDAAEMYNRLKALGGTVERFTPSADLVDYVSNCSVVIDAIFGIGLNDYLRGEALSAVSVINSSRAFVVSADIPSGVHADTGAILGDAVKANITVTFTLAKPGHFVEPGCIHCGELVVCDIGIPRHLISRVVSHMYAATAGDIHIPRRRRDSHKGDYGRAMILAGSVGYTGAPALSARSATKMGAGLVTVGVPKSIYDIMAVKLNEEMPFPLPDDSKGRLIANGASEILRRVNQSDVCLIGPGLGMSDDISELVQSVTRISKTPIVLDADGLNAITGNMDILNQAACQLILTPHPGEFERMTGINLTVKEQLIESQPEDNQAGDFASVGNYLTDEEIFDGNLPGDFEFDSDLFEEIKSGEKLRVNEPVSIPKPKPVDRLGVARAFASKYGCILVLKGHRTIIALPNGIIYVNTTGGPAMAKGGSGDVLAGMITALLAQKFPVVHAVAAAVYIHGLAGDMCAADYGEYCVTASDIIAMLPRAMKEIDSN